jgi:hypothetical protein
MHQIEQRLACATERCVKQHRRADRVPSTMVRDTEVADHVVADHCLADDGECRRNPDKTTGSPGAGVERVRLGATPMTTRRTSHWPA